MAFQYIFIICSEFQENKIEHRVTTTLASEHWAAFSGCIRAMRALPQHQDPSCFEAEQRSAEPLCLI